MTQAAKHLRDAELHLLRADSRLTPNDAPPSEEDAKIALRAVHAATHSLRRAMRTLAEPMPIKPAPKKARRA